MLGASSKSGEKVGAGLRELHVGAALVQPKPAAINRELEAGGVFGRAALRSAAETIKPPCA